MKLVGRAKIPLKRERYIDPSRCLFIRDVA